MVEVLSFLYRRRTHRPIDIWNTPGVSRTLQRVDQIFVIDSRAPVNVSGHRMADPLTSLILTALMCPTTTFMLAAVLDYRDVNPVEQRIIEGLDNMVWVDCIRGPGVKHFTVMCTTAVTTMISSALRLGGHNIPLVVVTDDRFLFELPHVVRHLAQWDLDIRVINWRRGSSVIFGMNGL